MTTCLEYIALVNEATALCKTASWLVQSGSAEHEEIRALCRGAETLLGSADELHAAASSCTCSRSQWARASRAMDLLESAFCELYLHGLVLDKRLGGDDGMRVGEPRLPSDRGNPMLATVDAADAITETLDAAALATRCADVALRARDGAQAVSLHRFVHEGISPS